MPRVTLWSSTNGDTPANLALTNNFAATTAPGVGNDSSQNYQVGSTWVNTASGISYVAMDVTKGAAVWTATANGSGAGITQAAPASQDTAATLTAAQLLTGIITSNPAGAIALTLPLATAMDTALPKAAANSAFDFSIVNTSSTGANTDTVTTNTGWTLVGNMVITPATTGGTSGRFRARKTATGAWTLYRLA